MVVELQAPQLSTSDPESKNSSAVNDRCGFPNVSSRGDSQGKLVAVLPLRIKFQAAALSTDQ